MRWRISLLNERDESILWDGVILMGPEDIVMVLNERQEYAAILYADPDDGTPVDLLAEHAELKKAKTKLTALTGRNYEEWCRDDRAVAKAFGYTK